MPDRALRIAVVAGEMYDGLYRRLPQFESSTGIPVEIACHAAHPELNAHLASLSDMPYDLVSSHTKYAPSQIRLLAPLDSLADELETGEFYSSLIDLASIDGHLYGIPRNIDIKLLHYRTDLLKEPPGDWNCLLDIASKLSRRALYGFVFPGTESGLFGLFYELAEMGGAALFPASNELQLNNSGGKWALEIIRDLYQSGEVPPEITSWQYDEAHRCFREGWAAMICDWPGHYGAYRNPTISKISERFALARMPAGPTRIHKAYAGAHGFSLTRRGVDRPGSVELLRFLTSAEQQLIEACQGSVPARPAVLKQIRSAAEPSEVERWNLLDLVIANDMLTPPAFSYYPEIEDILWRTVRSAMTAEIGLEEALKRYGKPHHQVPQTSRVAWLAHASGQ